MVSKVRKSELHTDVVDANTERAAERLVPVLEGAFYLAGGTAAALQMGHRISLDLDLFSDSETLSERARRRIIQELKQSGDTEILEDMNETVHLRLEGRTVSLFHHPYPLLELPKLKWAGLPLAGLRDLSAMKLNAVVGRGAKKDFFDLYFLAKVLGLEDLMDTGKKRFQDHPAFVMSAAKALVYFADAEREPMPRMKSSVSWDEVKRFFDREVPKYVRTQLKPGP